MTAETRLLRKGRDHSAAVVAILAGGTYRQRCRPPAPPRQHGMVGHVGACARTPDSGWCPGIKHMEAWAVVHGTAAASALHHDSCCCGAVFCDLVAANELLAPVKVGTLLFLTGRALCSSCPSVRDSSGWCCTLLCPSPVWALACHIWYLHWVLGACAPGMLLIDFIWLSC